MKGDANSDFYQFVFSGIRPVRKFPDNFLDLSKSRPLTKARSEAPIRMSAQLKSNPISVAQREKMERKSGPAIERLSHIYYINHCKIFFRFKLTEVSQVQSNLQSDGWFSSKLLTMKLLSSGVSSGGQSLSLTNQQNSKFCLSKIIPGNSKKVRQ